MTWRNAVERDVLATLKEWLEERGDGDVHESELPMLACEIADSIPSPAGWTGSTEAKT